MRPTVAELTDTSEAPPHARSTAWRRTTVGTLLAIAAIFYALHWLHLRADFPNNSPWSDWSKYTDEGWYGDAAIRHYTSGHWYFAGDFNPAVALPVWPALEWIVFRFTGVSAQAARGLTLVVFALTLAAFYWLIARTSRPRTRQEGPSLAPAIVVLLLSVSPYLFVFERMAILEPLLIALTALAILAASYLHPLTLSPRRTALQAALPAVALAILLPAIVLTKTTGIFLFPAIAYMVWARAGYRLRAALRLAVLPALAGAALWCVYFFGFVRPHYLEDYQYLFSANAYTGIALAPLYSVVLNTLGDGTWIGTSLYLCFFTALGLALFWRPRLFRNPLAPTLLLWIAGYFFFLAYHNNLQPRYYLVIGVPATAFVAIAIEEFRRMTSHRAAILAGVLSAFAYATILLPDALQQVKFVQHPTYDFANAAQSIHDLVVADKTHPHLILSISGSDITLMTGLPSIDDDFGTLDLAVRVQQYRPGWYVAWNELDDDKADAIAPLYDIVRVAAFPAMDDADRNLLILYRLDPVEARQAPKPRHRRTPKPLVTRLGQQPSVGQLEH